MRTTKTVPSASPRLPRDIRALFWDYPGARLSWKADRDLIIGRVLAAGPWESIGWLRRRLSNTELAAWLQGRRGAGLSAKQLRFWELILGLPHRQVNSWLADPARQAWEGRLRA